MDLIKTFKVKLTKAKNNLKSPSETVKKTIYGACGLVFCGLLIKFLFSQSKGDNTLTDWISATANIVMAGAAIIGVLYARRYVKELATKDGYQVAVELKQTILPSLQSGIYTRNKVSSFHLVANRCVNSEIGTLNYIDRNAIVNVFETIIEINKIHLKFTRNYNEFRKSLDHLETYGWSAHKGKKIDFKEVVDSLDNNALLFLYIRNSISHKFYPYFKDKNFIHDIPLDAVAEDIVIDTKFLLSITEDDVLNFKKLCEDFDASDERKELAIRKFIEGDGDIFTYFKPK